jgi:hypothetical protein
LQTTTSLFFSNLGSADILRVTIETEIFAHEKYTSTMDIHRQMAELSLLSATQLIPVAGGQTQIVEGEKKKRRPAEDFEDALDLADTPREVVDLILQDLPSTNQSRKALKKWAELVEELAEERLDAQLDDY